MPTTSYRVGFVFYGIISLASGRFFGLDSVRFPHDHGTTVSAAYIIVGLLLLMFGWRHPE